MRRSIDGPRNVRKRNAKVTRRTAHIMSVNHRELEVGPRMRYLKRSVMDVKLKSGVTDDIPGCGRDDNDDEECELQRRL